MRGGHSERGAVAPVLLTALLAVGVAGLWGMLVLPGAPASTPIRFDRDSLLPPLDPLPRVAEAGGTRVRLGFVGDIMQHRGQRRDDFTRTYAGVAPWLRELDLLVGNLEFPVDSTRLVGPAPGTTRFNGSPRHLDALADAGFDVLVTANNHAHDQGIDGMRATLRALESRGITPAGTWWDAERHAARVAVRDVGGIRVAIDAFTLPLNAYRDSAGRYEWPPRDLPITVLNFADWRNEYRRHGVEVFRRRAALARRAGAEFLVAYVHWGKEWRFAPTADQRRAARDLIDAGFDLVVGSHGHVMNGAELYRGRLIAYSLGNFVSDFRPLETRVGLVLTVDLVRPGPGARPRVAAVELHPTVVDGADHAVHPARASTGSGAALALSLARELLGPNALGADSGRPSDSLSRSGPAR